MKGELGLNFYKYPSIFGFRNHYFYLDTKEYLSFDIINNIGIKRFKIINKYAEPTMQGAVVDCKIPKSEEDKFILAMANYMV